MNAISVFRRPFDSMAAWWAVLTTLLVLCVALDSSSRSIDDPFLTEDNWCQVVELNEKEAVIEDHGDVYWMCWNSSNFDGFGQLLPLKDEVKSGSEVLEEYEMCTIAGEDEVNGTQLIRCFGSKDSDVSGLVSRFSSRFYDYCFWKFSKNDGDLNQTVYTLNCWFVEESVKFVQFQDATEVLEMIYLHIYDDALF